jgi:hypothetical protein
MEVTTLVKPASTALARGHGPKCLQVAALVSSLVRQSGNRADFPREVRFALPILIPTIAPHSLTILSSKPYTVSLLTASLNNQLKQFYILLIAWVFRSELCTG